MSLLKIEDRQPTTTLDKLSEEVRRDLARLEYPPDRKWTLDRSVDRWPVSDVLIIGGGQSGLTLAFALRQERVDYSSLNALKDFLQRRPIAVACQR